MNEALAEIETEKETLTPEISKWYDNYAHSTWNSINAMNYPETGLPSDHLHYLINDENSADDFYKIDKTSPTNIGFSLACIGAANALGFIKSPEAESRIDKTLTTIEKMMTDPKVFISTTEGKGLFINWIKPSTGEVLTKWPSTENEVKQQVSTVDNAWLIAFSKLISSQFPQFTSRIDNYLNQVDLPFMFNQETGFFHGCYLPNSASFENWHYDVISEARISYLVGAENIAELMGNLINRKSKKSIFYDSKGRPGRATWGGSGFEEWWPRLLVPEDKLNNQWKDNYKATLQGQKDFGTQHNGGHYGYSDGLNSEGQYINFRVPDSGESPDQYKYQSESSKPAEITVVTVSALVNTGMEEPVETYEALKQLHQEFPKLTHKKYGDGDTVNTNTGAIQRDQLLPNQAASLLSCWNIIKDGEAQNFFMSVIHPSISKIYKLQKLW